MSIKIKCIAAAIAAEILFTLVAFLVGYEWFAKTGHSSLADSVGRLWFLGFGAPAYLGYEGMRRHLSVGAPAASIEKKSPEEKGEMLERMRVAKASKLVGGLAGIASAVAFAWDDKPIGATLAAVAILLVVPAELILQRARQH